MSEKFDIVFNSEDIHASNKFQIASGFISQTTILFEKENIIAVVQAKGSVEFLDRDHNLIAAGSVPAVESGKGVYEDILCDAETGRITLSFPIYQWIDNYPNCDGEHDRWDTEIVGYHPLSLNLITGTIE